jgi:hypothetical protein
MAVIGTRQHDSVDSEIDDDRLPDYRAAAVAECIKFSEERAKLYPGGTVIREVYLPVDGHIINTPEADYVGTTAGYLDFAVISADEKEAEIIDWKFGNNAVEDASNNVQGIGYALGVLRKYPTLEKITVRFVMPHLDQMSEHTFTADKFEGMLLRIRTIVNRAIEARKDPDDFSMANANSSSCLFCGLIGKCPKVAEAALKLGKKYKPLEIPANVTPSLVNDPKDVAVGMRLASIVSTWAEAFKRQASAKTVEDPDFIPEGYTLVASQRRIVKKARKLGELAKTYLPEESRSQVDELYSIPIGVLEELISTYAKRGAKESTVEEFGEKALDTGVLELGKEYAFLRQARKQDTGKIAKK